MRITPLLLAVSSFVCGVPVAAGVKPLILDLESRIEAPRWMFEKSQLVTARRVPRTLFQIRKHSEAQQWHRCLQQIDTIWTSATQMRPWLLVEELKCVRHQAAGEKRLYPRLTKALLKADRNSRWLATGPFSAQLQKEVIEAHMVLLEKEAKFSRKSAWRTVDRLQQMKSWMSRSQEAELFRVMGGLAERQRKQDLAQAYFIRSLRMQESSQVRSQLRSLLDTRDLEKHGVPQAPREIEKKEAMVSDLAMSEEEAKLVRRFRRSLKKGDWLAAITDGVKLIREFPGSDQSQWASKKILRTYRKVAWKRDHRWQLIRKKVVSTMKKADGERLLYWAGGAFGWGYYEDAFVLAAQASEKLKGLSDSGKALLLAGRAANTVGKYGDAEEFYEKLIEDHSGSPESLEGYFRWGLLNFRRKKYSRAATKFERLISITDESKFDLRSRYWLWRSLQKAGSERAEAFGRALYERYPLTYYGLRALSELSRLNQFLKNKEKVQLRHRLWLSESESRTWNRFQTLLKAGWFREAQAELRFLPTPQLPIEMVLFSRLWGKAFDHFYAISLVQKAWDFDRSLLTRETVQLSYPLEFNSYVSKWSEKNDLDPFRVHALIKQESTYRSEVSSPSGAIGLMQLMPPTAREVASRLKIRGGITRGRLTDAELNVRLGTSYLKRLLRAYDGHFPLALAAYNVGIGNMRKWINARDELQGMTKKGSAIEDEIWIDELTWEETSHYIKAVLRNYIIYQILNRPIDHLPNPTWAAPDKKVGQR